MLLVNTVPTKVGAALSPGGAHRQDLITQLGQPAHTTAEPIPVHVKRNRSSTNAVCICDHYQISGLVQVQGEPYASDWKEYPVLMLVTFGLCEVFVFPYVAVDLTVKSFHEYDLRVWYDCADNVLTHEKRKRNEPE